MQRAGNDGCQGVGVPQQGGKPPPAVQQDSTGSSQTSEGKDDNLSLTRHHVEVLGEDPLAQENLGEYVLRSQKEMTLGSPPGKVYSL